MNDETIVVEASNHPGVAFSDGTFQIDLKELLGDPLETVVVRSSGDREPDACEAEVGARAFTARTELGRRLLEIREKAISDGEAPVSLRELERELDELRSTPEDRLE